jgi:DNA-binding MarR family transcriptional regulator
MLALADECAREVLEVVPLLMQVIRSRMRSQRRPGLSVPQFRTLTYLQRHPGATLSDIAEHLGLTLPSMSKLIDGLVGQDLVSRKVSPADRRYVTLILTPLGQTTFQSARQATQIQLAQLLATLSDAERAIIIQAMQALRPLCTPEHEVGRVQQNELKT